MLGKCRRPKKGIKRGELWGNDYLEEGKRLRRRERRGWEGKRD